MNFLHIPLQYYVQSLSTLYKSTILYLDDCHILVLHCPQLDLLKVGGTGE